MPVQSRLYQAFWTLGVPNLATTGVCASFALLLLLSSLLLEFTELEMSLHTNRILVMR